MSTTGKNTTAAATDTVTERPPVFSVDGLWKVFGPKAARVPADPDLTALSPAELRSAPAAPPPSPTSPSTCARARSSSSWACPAPASPPSYAA